MRTYLPQTFIYTSDAPNQCWTETHEHKVHILHKKIAKRQWWQIVDGHRVRSELKDAITDKRQMGMRQATHLSDKDKQQEDLDLLKGKARDQTCKSALQAIFLGCSSHGPEPSHATILVVCHSLVLSRTSTASHQQCQGMHLGKRCQPESPDLMMFCLHGLDIDVQ